MNHPLDGAVLRIQKARSDLKELDSGIAQARRSSPYEVVFEPRGERPHYGPGDRHRRYEYVVRARLAQTASPFWGVLAGEATYNLRCSLDYLTFQLAVEKSRQNPPPSADLLQFPIVAKSSQLRDVYRNRVTLRGVSARARDLIRRFQPYPNRKDKTLRLLVVLSNHDKHRAPVVTTKAVVSGSLAFEKRGNCRVTNVKTHRGPARDGAEIGSFTLIMDGPDDAQVNVNANFAYQEVFDQPLELRGQPVMKTLESIRLVVERILREANPLFSQVPYEANADDYRRAIRFAVRKVVVPVITFSGGCRDARGAHWSIDDITRDGYDLVHRGDPHHDGYQEPRVVAEANP